MSEPAHICISEAAKRVGCAERTLRRYDARGIISPARDSGGRRVFSEHDIEIAKRYRERSRERFNR